MSKKILIACEESQAVCEWFRFLGYEAYSNDILETSGNHPEWHLKMDAKDALNLYDWDLMIAFPPCTYLTCTGNKWFYHPEDKDLRVSERRPRPKFANRRSDEEAAIEFFMMFANANVPRIAIENPVGVMSTIWRKPDQIIQPYYFGDSFSKKTCLWLKNLPKLEPTNIVDPGEFYTFKSGKKMAKWYTDLGKLTISERAKQRSKTFPGIAQQMAEQWSKVL